VRLGGRSAELIVLGQGSTGASNDLAGATELAVKMVREFGLSKTLGPIGYPSGGSAYLGGGGPEFSSRPYAEATQAAIDGEVSKLLREAESRATDLLGNHRRELTSLVDLLLEEETVDGADVYRLAGRPAPSEWTGATVAPRRVAVGDAAHLAAGGQQPSKPPPAAGSPTPVRDGSHRAAGGEPASKTPPAGGSPPPVGGA
jgi:cell division protease FtsH